MTDTFNNWHPLPRYGLAVAIQSWRARTDNRKGLPDFDDAALAEIATETLTDVQFGYLLHAQPEGEKADVVVYRRFNDIARLDPGSKSKQNAANGYFLAPHILTSKNSGMMVKEFKALQKALRGNLDKSFQLKRSFSPQTSKINAGTKSMSDPKDALLVAAFTAIGAATQHKAAALDFDSFTNIALVPDIPFFHGEEDRYPLLDYLYMLDLIQDNLGDAYVGPYDPVKKKYGRRPPIYNGNFKHALNNVQFGSLQLLAAFSGLIELGEEVDEERLKRLVDDLAGKPLLIIGYDYNGQEQYGSHLTELVASGKLYRALKDVWKIELIGVDSGKKYSDPKWKHLKRNLDRWLRRFDTPAFRGFLSVRATYPQTFLHPIYNYFIMQQIPEEIVDAAMAMGKSLNLAAFKAADNKAKEDKRENARDRYEYKARVLSSLEGNIRSAKTGSQLLSQVSTLVGRMTNYDLSAESSPFMKAVAADQIDIKVAQDLLIAFMRLNQSTKTAADDAAKPTTDADSNTESGSDIDD